MTRDEKKTAMERLSKRIDRFYSWVEYYDFNQPSKLMICVLKGVSMVNRLTVLASQPTEEQKGTFRERVQKLADQRSKR